jgi:hypothetical protein
MAVPFLVCVKVICDNVEGLSTLGSFLSAATAQPPGRESQAGEG